MAFVVLVALGLRLRFTFEVYGPQLWLQYPGDYWEYLEAAQSILDDGYAFENRIFLVRPPIYPLVMALARMHRPALIFFNMFCALLQIPLTYALVRRLGLGASVGLLASGLVALDPSHIKFSGTLIAEPLHSLLLVLALLFTTCAVNQHRSNASIRHCALAGLFLTLASFTRPSTYLLWIPLGFWLWFAWRAHIWRLVALLAFAVVPLSGTIVWSHHNLRTYNNGAFSVIGTYNLLHYRAQRYVGTSNARLAVEERLGGTLTMTNETFREATRTPDSHLEAAMLEAALNIILAHFPEYLQTSSRSFSQTLFEVWHPRPAWGQGFKTAVFVCALLGMEIMLHKRKSKSMFLLALPIVYFTVGTVAVCYTCMDTRATLGVVPLFAIAGAISLHASLGGIGRLSALCAHLLRREASADSS